MEGSKSSTASPSPKRKAAPSASAKHSPGSRSPKKASQRKASSLSQEGRKQKPVRDKRDELPGGRNREVDEEMEIDADRDGDGDDEDETSAEDVEYIRFLASMFSVDPEDDSIGHISMITDDDADDADFMPQDMISDGEEDDADDISGVDGELAKVTRYEIQDLMDGCWQTIAGPKNSNTSSSSKDAVDTRTPARQQNDHNHISSLPSSHSHSTSGADIEFSMESNVVGVNNSSKPSQTNGYANDSSTLSQASDPSSDERNSKLQPHTVSISSSSSSLSASDSAVAASRHGSSNNIQGYQKGGRLAHEKSGGASGAVVSHLLGDSRYNDLCFDEVPVSVIRNILIKQINMATQLLLQMLLVSDDKSECFDKCYKHIMELSNIRGSAVKKAKLMYLSLQNVTQYQSSLHTNLFGGKRGKEKRKEQKGIDKGVDKGTDKKRKRKAKEHTTHVHTHTNEMRLTRGSLANHPSSSTPVKGELGGKGLRRNPHQVRVQSVFDVPCVENLQEFFEELDQSRQTLSKELVEEVEAYTRKFQPAGSSNGGTTGSRKTGGVSLAERLQKDKAAANAPAPNVLLSNSQRWVMQLGIMKKHIKAILVKHGMRGWECVIPHSSYPLPKEEVEKANPGSFSSPLSTRMRFTPAEDDLLLRGLVSLGDDWLRIKQELLPAKDEQLLQFRFTKLTALDVPDNRFKKYIQLDKEKKSRDAKWTHSEDLNLLRGL